MIAETQIEPVRRKAVWGSRIRLATAVAGALLLTSCSEAIRQGQSPGYLMLMSLQGARGGGNSSGTFTSSLLSDVVTVVNGNATIFNDLGQATLQLVMKDPLAATSPANAITMTQYHVKYIRTDGRNVQGVDVPFEFDGGLGVTISGTGSVAFTLVRNQAKLEAPLRALAQNLQVVSTIAEVTFYGRDQNGREISVSGRIDVAFANFGD